ncbi:MAG: sulfite exporter TauE/SafE family protein [Pyrinomonadaceae bacterium]|nr:sulfite exporter TauE/SafE family protein [Pyrinomonadaceae bacterium]
MRKRLLIFTALFIFAFALPAAAHPLGNFSVNHYSRLEVEKSQVKIRAVLDMAEIPTFQESQTIDADRDGSLSQAELDSYVAKITPEYIGNLLISVDGNTIGLRPTATNISQPPGSGDLPTLRVEWDLLGDLPPSDATARNFRFENKNGLERIGWNEIVVRRVSGINIFDSTAFGSGITEELKAYPQESLSAPLAERKAEFSFTTDDVPPNAKILQNRDGHISAPVEKDKFAELITVPEITPQIILFGLLVAFGFGAAHALSPGHGKAVVGAYLVGTKGTPKHAVFLGITVTITHTLSVFALGIIALFASEYILPERLMPFLSFVSGLMVLVIGLTLFKNRLLAMLGYQTGDSHHQAAHERDDLNEDFTHTHGGSTHSHLPPKQVTWKNLLFLGISGGLLPCPSALVLMLAAIAKDRIAYGLVLTLVFSFGLAATLTAIGLIFLYGGKFLNNPALGENRIVKALPVFSAFVIACVGAVICYNSLV